MYRYLKKFLTFVYSIILLCEYLSFIKYCIAMNLRSYRKSSLYIFNNKMDKTFSFPSCRKNCVNYINKDSDLKMFMNKINNKNWLRYEKKKKENLNIKVNNTKVDKESMHLITPMEIPIKEINEYKSNVIEYDDINKEVSEYKEIEKNNIKEGNEKEANNKSVFNHEMEKKNVTIEDTINNCCDVNNYNSHQNKKNECNLCNEENISDIDDIKEKNKNKMNTKIKKRTKERTRKKLESNSNNDNNNNNNNDGDNKNEDEKRTRREQVRKKLSDLAKMRWQNEEERKKLLRSKNKFKHTEKTKKLLSYKIKLKWTDENYRKRIIEKTRIFNQDENTKRRKSILLKEKWKMKDFREKMLCNRKPYSVERRQKLSEIIKQKWREDDYKNKTLTAIKENYKKRKLLVGLNPNFNYIQNVMLFRQLGISAPKIRFFPEIHKQKLRGKKKRKHKREKENYKENWKNIYDNLLDKNEFQSSLSYLNKLHNLSVSAYL
ncbi:conserved Plasmodium protein, unknown function [Plasmodium sp. gorilla clade G3]|nr:conserved Plasmodium protein, unknown function [Plasmodium sp. gorilla clade G3]